MPIHETPTQGTTVARPAPDAALYRGFFDASRQALFVLDGLLTIVECNPAARSMLAAHSDALLHGSFLDNVEKSDRGRVELLLRDAMAGSGRSGEIRAELCRRDDATFPAELSIAPFPSPDRGLLAIVVRDRTMAERTQQRLRKEQDAFRKLFTNAPVPLREEDFSAVGIWFEDLRSRGVTDLTTYIDAHEDEFVDAIMSIRTTRVNPAFMELMKADTEAELLTGFQSPHFSTGTLDSFRKQFVTMWRGGDYHEASFVGYDRAGKPFECFVTVSVQQLDGELDMSRVVAAFLDLTEIQANQRSLERLIADKDQFIASVSHELRTPLASVLGLSDELHNHWDRFDEEEIRQLLGVIADQSSDLSTLVEDLLVAAKAEMGALAVTPDRMLLDETAAEAVGEVVSSGTLAAPIPITGSAGAAHADAVRVRQIVRNLVTNAVRYGGDSVRVELGRSDLPFLRVMDDGAGIPQDERDRVFDPYHRAVGTDARLGALGLGLTISRQLARTMDGDLTYAYEDGHSIFTLTLPSAR